MLHPEPRRIQRRLGVQAAVAHRKLAARMAAEAYPLDYSTAMRVIRDALAALSPAPVVVAEGANTMDNARCARAARLLDAQGRVGLGPLRLSVSQQSANWGVQSARYVP